MKHLKRHAVPKKWPTPRKGTTFVVRPNSNIENSLPLLVILRDILKIAQNRKEVKKALVSNDIIINGKYAKDEKNSATILDVITIVPSKKSYRVGLGLNGKFKVEEISEKESGKKISKIIDKKVLKGKKIQLNLIDGRNFVSNVECKVGDSVLINFKDKKIEKCLPLKEKAKVMVFAGKHTGKNGNIEKIKAERKMASIISEQGKINVLLKQLMVIE